MINTRADFWMHAVVQITVSQSHRMSRVRAASTNMIASLCNEDILLTQVPAMMPRGINFLCFPRMLVI